MFKSLGLVAIVSVSLISAVFVFSRVYVLPHMDAQSYAFGMLYAFTVFGISFAIPRMWFYFRQRGWLSTPVDWWSRIQLMGFNDWTHISGDGWDIELFGVRAYRNKTTGALWVCVAVFGLHAHLDLMVDRDERERHTKIVQAEREAALRKMPPQMRELVRRMSEDGPSNSRMEVSVVELPTPDFDDDDDDEKGGGGVH